MPRKDREREGNHITHHQMKWQQHLNKGNLAKLYGKKCETCKQKCSKFDDGSCVWMVFFNKRERDKANDRGHSLCAIDV